MRESRMDERTVTSSHPHILTISSSSSSREVVERPVERLEDDLELVLFEELPLRGEDMRLDEREDGALDRAAGGEQLRRRTRVGGDELLCAPGEDRADADLIVRPIDVDTLRAGDALRDRIL